MEADKSTLSAELKEAIAFRVIADHLRTLSFSLADGIMLGNTGRNYVLRRILRRAVRYGRTLGFTGDKPFLAELVDTLVEQMSAVFPELKERQQVIKDNLHREEASFNETLDRGLAKFEEKAAEGGEELDGAFAFQLYDTFGFPIDLTELLCAERGMKVDMKTFEQLMEEQREKGRAAQTKELIRAADIATEASTEFTGFEQDATEAKVLEIHQQPECVLIITDKTPFYVEMGGQLGDKGTLVHDGHEYPVSAVQQLGNARAHVLELGAPIDIGDTVTLSLETERRRPIEAHHTATHLLHLALHEIVSEDASQQGSMVSRTRLRFDFNSGAVPTDTLEQLEERVNGWISAGDSVSWIEVLHADIQGRKDIQQFFGDKYGDVVRVVQIGGETGKLDGYSMELCGGTHVRNTKDIGIFKIKSEGAIASGIRRIEAVCGEAAWDWMRGEVEKGDVQRKELRSKLDKANQALQAIGEEAVEHADFPHIMGALLVEAGDFRQINATYKHFHEHIASLREAGVNAEKKLKKAQAGAAAKMADESLAGLLENGGNMAELFEGPANLLQELLNGLKKKQFKGAAFLVVNDGQRLHLGAYCGENAQSDGLMAGKLIQELGPIAGGKGGGKPDMARGAAPDLDKADELLKAAQDAI